MKLTDKVQIGISAFAAIVSVTAIAVSMYSNAISHSAYELSLNSFNAERRIAVRTIREEDHIAFSPLEDGQQIHSMTVFFPSELNIGTLVLTPPDLKIYDTRINFNIQDHIEEQIPGRERFAQVALNYPIPALIMVHGYSKGYASMSVGIYDFIYAINRVEDSAGLRLKSAVLNNFHYEVSDPQAYIDRVFAESRRIIASNK
ncbi:hypothetical protein [Parahaliea mediterranea]|uniref:Uncharacterized protein n=1 Tax=Parahaliea mediterranea TaxID=651086 RepID=A0A939DKI4_9GAMM|nr:hypothetical protein [Parahaliea mediterranea]MBN7799177.1 hypothetical protein [Parahaliea mediterranea]